ncbi:hypothetical protein TNCV_483101 [Trichonephila clavipes]|uniref:Uncharacterized protein n=1 Tax=Trichonephila clavipes TaxID=2585209 RepID=A0A8X6RFH9_TRICX|nr:hypothetical protein TNCV_483101 [Trichonephila clavipes]
MVFGKPVLTTGGYTLNSSRLRGRIPSPQQQTVDCHSRPREGFDSADETDTVIEIPRVYPKLSENAYPCIFPGCPSYLTPTPLFSSSPPPVE